MIATRRPQMSFADGFISEMVSDLWEPWMRHADQALEDEVLLLIIQQALSKRCKKSKTRGRPGTTAEILLRMMLLKHFRDWSFEDLTREVRANLVYREFTRIGGGKVPDDKTMGRLARQLGPDVVEKIHRRIVEIALEKKVASGRKLRVDTTVVETDIHYPTDSSLLGDGTRVLIRVMKKVAGLPEEWARSCGTGRAPSNCGCWRSREPAATRPRMGRRNCSRPTLDCSRRRAVLSDRRRSSPKKLPRESSAAIGSC